MSGPFGAGGLQLFGAAGFYPYSIDQSLRFEDGDNPYLSKTFSSSGGTVFTLSCWVKIADHKTSRTLLQGYSNSSNYSQIILYGGTAATDGWIGMYSAVGGSTKLYKYTSGLFRDPTAWYHVVVKFNGTSGSEEFKIYVNGENQTLTTSTALTAHQSLIGNSNAQYVGNNFNQSLDMNGYLAEYHFIDGTALDADSFGETKAGIWIPKEYSGSYGTNGFYLDFADGSALGDDESGNANDFTVSGLAATDVVLDSPTNNWSTMNSLNGDGGTTWKEGNLELSTTNYGNNASTFFMETGKWYWEAMGEGYVGAVCAFDRATYNNTISVSGSDSIGYFHNGTVYWGTGTDTTPATYSSTDIIGVAVNMDDGQISFYKNNTLQVTLNFSSTISRLATEGCYANYNNGASSANRSVNFNFGQDSSFAGNKTAQGNTDGNGKGDFYYSPPSGFLCLASVSLPDPAIDPAKDEEPADYFNTVLYTGTGSAPLAITGVGFQPDWIWLKRRSATSNHHLFDSVRGTDKFLQSSTSDAEQTGSNNIDSFDSDGFTLNATSATNPAENNLNSTYVAWNWLAGGSASSNSNGSITSSVSANTKAGFSIVSYTGNGSAGATVGHGLASAPELFINKRRSQSDPWQTYVASLGATKRLELDATSAAITSTASFNDTEPNSSVFTLGSGGYGNASSATYIAYCFHSVDGYSKVGTYSGNGSSDGSFIYTGFRPSWVMTKRIDSTGGWVIVDNKRNTHNLVNNYLRPDSSTNELTANVSDFLSNGFKLRSTTHNESGSSYIYLAFAEQPFKYSNAR